MIEVGSRRLTELYPAIEVVGERPDRVSVTNDVAAKIPRTGDDEGHTNVKGARPHQGSPVPTAHTGGDNDEEADYQRRQSRVFNTHGNSGQSRCQQQLPVVFCRLPIEERPERHQLEKTEADVDVAQRRKEDYSRYRQENSGGPDSHLPFEIPSTETDEGNGRTDAHHPVHELGETAVTQGNCCDVEHTHVVRIESARYRALETEMVVDQEQLRQRELIGERVGGAVRRSQCATQGE